MIHLPMLQLIYTSAPRLLEAGKTGFGTVARSRQLPQSVVNYLERISTFDRAAGVDSLQCYSVFRMGQLVYHVFSRIGDCGVDYTRRTNHIAHHFIMPNDAMQECGWTASTPAAFMLKLQYQWKTQWTENPAWLEEATEPAPLANGGSDTWQRFTGNEHNAQWLSTLSYTEGGNILLPATCTTPDTLSLLHEACMQRHDKGWGLGFSTAVVSTLSSTICPLVCLTPAQIHAGVKPRTGYPLLQVDAHLAPPTEADFPLPEPEIDWEIPVEDSSTGREWGAPTTYPQELPRFEAPAMPLPQKTVQENRTPTLTQPKKEETTWQKYSGAILIALLVIVALAAYNHQTDKKAPTQPPSTSQKPNPQNPPAKKQKQEQDAAQPPPANPQNPAPQNPLTNEQKNQQDGAPQPASDALPPDAADEAPPAITSQHDAHSHDAKVSDEEAPGEPPSADGTAAPTTTPPPVQAPATYKISLQPTDIKPTDIKIEPKGQSFCVSVSVPLQYQDFARGDSELNHFSMLQIESTALNEGDTIVIKEKSILSFPDTLEDLYSHMETVEKEAKEAKKKWRKKGKIKPKISKNELLEKLNSKSITAEQKKQLETLLEKNSPSYQLEEKEKEAGNARDKYEQEREKSKQRIKDTISQHSYVVHFDYVADVAVADVTIKKVQFPDYGNEWNPNSHWEISTEKK